MQKRLFPLQQKIDISSTNTCTYAASSEIRLNKFWLLPDYLERDAL